MTTLGRHPDALTVKLALGDGAHLIATAANGWAGPVTLHYGPRIGEPVISDPGTVDGDTVSWTLTEEQVTARAGQPMARLEDNGVTVAAGNVITWRGGLGSTQTQTIASLVAGPPGPTAVSADADNVATISPNDGLIYVSPADAGGFSDAAVAAFVDDTGSSTYASILAGFAATDDARLSDARTPTAHEHTAADIDAGASADGQVLTSDGVGGAAWETPASGVTDHGLLSGLGDDDHAQYALADGSRGAFAAPLGVDDNYVTDAEKTKLANLSGTNTGDQDLSGLVPTSRTVNGKALSANVTLNAADVGASTFSGDYDDLIDKPTLGDAAAKNTGTTAGTVAAGDDSRITGAAQKSANLSDLANAGTARTNLGLGTAATTAASAYATAAQGALADTALQVATAQPINTQTGTTYTLQASDAGKLVTLNNTVPITLNAPGSVFTAGQRVDVVVLGAGMATVVGTSGATANGTPTLVSRAQYSAFTVVWLSATSAVVIGDMASA